MPIAAESGHWYHLDGRPCYTLIGANGKERATTLRDARKLNLAPSVTTIMQCAAKPALADWKERQVLLAALTLTRGADETDDAWIDRIIADSREQASKAAEKGRAIHASIERAIQGQDYDPEHKLHVGAALAVLAERCGSIAWSAEKSFASPQGYGGKVDLHGGGWVIDLKTKDFRRADAENGKRLAWDEHAMQLAAYAHGLGMPGAHCANLFVSTSAPGKAVWHEWEPQQLTRGSWMFLALLDYWEAKNRYSAKEE